MKGPKKEQYSVEMIAPSSYRHVLRDVWVECTKKAAKKNWRPQEKDSYIAIFNLARDAFDCFLDLKLACDKPELSGIELLKPETVPVIAWGKTFSRPSDDDNLEGGRGTMEPVGIR